MSGKTSPRKEEKQHQTYTTFVVTSGTGKPNQNGGRRVLPLYPTCNTIQFQNGGMRGLPLYPTCNTIGRRSETAKCWLWGGVGWQYNDPKRHWRTYSLPTPLLFLT